MRRRLLWRVRITISSGLSGRETEFLYHALLVALESKKAFNLHSIPSNLARLKCNRSTPCENCVKRGESSTCSYAPPGTRKKTGSRSQPSGTPDDMQNRIDKLEGLVLSLMGSGNDSQPPGEGPRAMSVSTSSNSNTPFTPQGSDDTHRDNDSVESDTDKVVKSFGVLHFNNNNNQASYIGDSHWATILHEISEVKNYFKEHQKQYEEAVKTVEATRKQAGLQASGPAFLLVGRNPPDFKELVNRLPRRPEVDQLVQRYLDDHDPSLCVLHIPSWRRRYEKYWQNPNCSDASFLGQLFAMCGLAMQSYSKNQDEPYEYQGRSQDLSAMFRSLTQQCLQLVDYAKIEQTTIETMCLHLIAEYHKTGEADIGLWVLSRMVISLAMRFGVHRDGKNFCGISPFQCEMRRRVWAFLRTVDTIWSFAVGLPSMILENDIDTEMPSNLEDTDYDEDTEMMPPSRPRSEFTEVSYLIAKAELSCSFSRITAAVSGTRTITYEEIVQLDNEIRDMYHGTFPILQMNSGEESQPKSRQIFVMRITLSILYNKTLCVLHRKYLTRSREHHRFNPSRQACIDASLALLRNQQILDKESRVEGSMHRLQYHITSIMTHDFILAGTLIALDLLGSVQAQAAGGDSGDIEIWGADRMEEEMRAIEGARAIWGGLKDRYVEAYKAYSICGVMLQKINQGLQQVKVQNMASGTVFANGLNSTANNGNSQPNTAKTEPPSAITLGMFNSEMMNGWKAGSYSGTQTNDQMAASSGDLSNVPNFPIDASMANNNAFSFFNNFGAETPANMDWVIYLP